MIGDPELCHGIERLAVAAVGAFSLYCGYRLFLGLPARRREAAGPGLGARWPSLSAAAPASLYALLGLGALLAAFFLPVHAPAVTGGTAAPATEGFTPASSGPSAAAPAPRPMDLGDVRQSMAFLTDAETEILLGAGEGSREWISRRFRAAKLAILGRAWQDDWGNPAEFERWLEAGPSRPADAGFEKALAVLEAAY